MARVVSGSYDKTIRMWDVQPGKELWRQEADFYPVTAYSPAGDVVVSGESHDLIRF
jgi:WD40 repeat protein